MRGNEFLDKMGLIDSAYIEAANVKPKQRKYAWLKRGAMAACLCLVIVGVAVWSSSSKLFGNTPGGGGGAGEGIDGVGAWPDGIDPFVASVAVIPAEKSLSDVADATVVSINEEDARNIERLGAYLPDILPKGCRYGSASYYETTMKDGTQYHMIRVVYESGQGAVPAPVTEDDQVAPEMSGNTAFLWMVWGHRPNTDRHIYQPDEVTTKVLDQMDGGVFYIDYGSIYIGISRMDISTEELMTVIDSIG